MLCMWLLLTSVREVVPGFGVYDSKRVLELFTIPLLLFFVLANKEARNTFSNYLKIIPNWIWILIITFFGIGLISGLRTEHPSYSLVDVSMFLSLSVAVLCVATSKSLLGKRFDKIALLLLSLMMLAVTFQELIGFFVYATTNQQFNYRESLFHFLHPRLYNHIQTWTIPVLALLPVVFRKVRWINAISLLLIGSQWYIILYTGSRGTPVSLVTALLIVGLLQPGTRKLWLKLHVSGLVLGVLFYIAAIGLLETTQPDQTAFVKESIGRPMLHTSGRTDLWKHAFDDVKQHPLLGAGPMRFACGVEHHLPGSPHSFPIQIISEWGMPAFISLVIIFAWLIYVWANVMRLGAQKSDQKQVVFACLSISFVAALVHVNVSSLHIAPAGQVAGVLILGWLLGSISNLVSASSKAGSNILGALVLTLGLIASVSVVVFSMGELKDLSFRTSYAQDNEPIVPRFWQNGRVCEYQYNQ